MTKKGKRMFTSLMSIYRQDYLTLEQKEVLSVKKQGNIARQYCL